MFMGAEGHHDRFWDPSDKHGDRRLDWNLVGDATGSAMQRMVRDVNNLRWQHAVLRSAAGNVVHVDDAGQVVAFKRYTLDGDVVLVVINVSDNRWDDRAYGVNMGGESHTWAEIFPTGSRDRGINTNGNFGAAIEVEAGKLFIDLPSWCVLMFRKG